MLEKFEKFEWLNGVNAGSCGVGVSLVDGKFCHVQVTAYSEEDFVEPLTVPQAAKLLRELNTARGLPYLDVDYTLEAEDAFLRAVEELGNR